MDKETKLGLTVPWIGLICFSINIITTIIYLFNSSFGFVIPISIFFGFLTILSWAYIIFTAFPLIWKLMTPSEIYQKVYKFNVFIFLFSMLIFPFLVLSVIFSLIGFILSACCFHFFRQQLVGGENFPHCNYFYRTWIFLPPIMASKQN